MKTLLQCMRDHPLQSIGFTAYFVFLATSVGFRPDLLWLAIGAYSAGLGVFAVLLLLHDLDKEEEPHD